MRHSVSAALCSLLLLATLSNLPLAAQAAEEGRLTTEPGVEIYWQSSGSGPAVIVPGGFLYGDALAPLAAAHRVVLYDMRNRGRSSAVRDPALLTLEGDVRDLEALRAHLGIDSFAAVGYSYLGKMVVLYALRHPEHVERLVQIGPVPVRFAAGMPPQHDATGERVLDPAALAALRRLRAEGVHESQPQRYCEEEWRVRRVQLLGDPTLVDQLPSPCAHENEWPVRFAEHLRHHFASARAADVDPAALAALDVPVLTIHGTRDRNAPYGSGREWAALLPNGRLRTVAGGAHQAWVDDPAVLADLATFLAGSWPAAAREVELAREEWLAQLRGVELLARVAAAYRPPAAGGGGTGAAPTPPTSPPSVDGLPAFALRATGHVFAHSQSFSPRPPFDDFAVEADLHFAPGAAAVAVDETLHWPGFDFRYRTVGRPDGGFELDLTARQVVAPAEPPPESWVRQLARVPLPLVTHLLASPQAVRLLGVERAGDGAWQLVSGQLGDERLTLWIDGEDRVRKVARLASDDLLGDTLEETELLGEQTIDGMVVPQRVRRLVDGALLAELALAPGGPVDLARLEIPGDFAPLDPGQELELTIAPLGRDLWMLHGIGGQDYRSLVAVHDDGLVVLETPVSEAAMRAVVERLRERFPGTPIKAAVVMHHHFDHSGGVRALMATGARILVPRGSEGLFDRVAAAPRTLQPEAAEVDVWALRLEGIGAAPPDETVLAGATAGPAVHLHALPDNGHAEGMLYAWIPEHGVLFQGDLFVKLPGEPQPAREQGVALLAAVDRLGLPVERLVGVHGEIASLADLRTAVALRTTNAN